MALHGWHRGERAVRKKLGYDNIPSLSFAYRYITGDISDFKTTRLPFLPVTTLDRDGRPWGSILAGKDGKPGFIRYSKDNTVLIKAEMWDGEPFLDNMGRLEAGERMLIAGVGVEVSTRRRNKLAGIVARAKNVDGAAEIELVVNQGIGNCPKYITIRDLVSHRNTSPRILHQRPHLLDDERIPPDAVALILQSDTVFLGTTYVAADQEEACYPSHLGMNHRGGKPGFIRVKPSDGRTLVLPDLSGNRIMTSLGNVEATPLASLTFIDFAKGDILYLTGTAHNLHGEDSLKIMPFQDTLTEIYVTGLTFVEDAFPARQNPKVEIMESPYSPPIRRLAEETPQTTLFPASSHLSQPRAILKRVEVHSPTIMTFHWESSQRIDVPPGHAVILDMTPLLGTREYAHMAPSKPSSLNDDFIRTWTVSSFVQPSSRISATSSDPPLPHHSASSNPDDLGTNFAMTMREKPGGVVTGALFAIVRKVIEFRPDMLNDCRVMGLEAGVVGVTGNLNLVHGRVRADTALGGKEEKTRARNMVWFAGGIGITPFLSMLKAINSDVAMGGDRMWNVTLVLATRASEKELMLDLLSNSIGLGSNPTSEADVGHTPRNLNFSLHLFTGSTSSISNSSGGSHSTLARLASFHPTRVTSQFFHDYALLFSQPIDKPELEIFLCGSRSFEDVVMEGLRDVGVNSEKVSREGFTY